MIESYEVFVGKPKGRDCFGALGVDGRKILFHNELHAFVIEDKFKNISKLVDLASLLFVVLYQHVSLFCCFVLLLTLFLAPGR